MVQKTLTGGYVKSTKELFPNHGQIQGYFAQNEDKYGKYYRLSFKHYIWKN